jgi:hypothetical protein
MLKARAASTELGRFLGNCHVRRERGVPMKWFLIGSIAVFTSGTCLSQDSSSIPRMGIAGSDPNMSVANYQGMWAVPNLAEAGWGINIAHQGNIIFVSWFTYDVNGKPWWLTMTAQQQSDGSFTGAIDQTTGPPFNVPELDPIPVTHTSVGIGRLTFSDTNNGTFSYTVNGISQVKTLAQFRFSTPVPICDFDYTGTATQGNFQDYFTDTWVVDNLTVAGWGINFSQQGGIIFASWFTYDANGNPFWVSATLAGPSPDEFGVARTYTGALDATTGPPFNSVLFDPSLITHATVGTATVTFTDGANGTLAYTLNGVSQVKALTRFVFSAPTTVCYSFDY